MSGLLGSIWPILRSYRPNAARNRQTEKQLTRFGVFEATYSPPGWGIRGPRTDQEAQRMYNHIRTVAFWLDAAPVLADLGLPFRAGLDDIISLVPIYGDIASGVLQLYQVWLSFVFGVPPQILGYMLLNVLLDVLVGLVPLLGDFLDNLFKSNLRNLALLEEWLLNPPANSRARNYHILLMPESNEFLPKPKTKAGWGWFGGSGPGDVEESEREKEVRTGKVRATRRMGREEGGPVGVPVGGGGEPVRDPLD